TLGQTKFMGKLFALFACLVFSQIIVGQDKGNISILIMDEKEKPLSDVTVELLRAKDSSLVKVALSDATGNAEFEGIESDQYMVRAGMTGRMSAYSPPFNLASSNLSLPALVLSPLADELQGVTVTTRKPFIQRLTDRIVVNVENSIVSAGSFALDVLERAPGVNIDHNDVISLRGKSGVIIMIDGKPTAMGGQDLANYLRGLPSSSIDRIDIITNPSAKYDAAGNSGIIDIRMKKDQRMGINGTLTAGYGQGIYPKANAGASFNYRNKKVNVFGNYNYGYRVGLNHLILDRNFFEDGVYNGG